MGEFTANWIKLLYWQNKRMLTDLLHRIEKG